MTCIQIMFRLIIFELKCQLYYNFRFQTPQHYLSFSYQAYHISQSLKEIELKEVGMLKQLFWGEIDKIHYHFEIFFNLLHSLYLINNMTQKFMVFSYKSVRIRKWIFFHIIV